MDSFLSSNQAHLSGRGASLAELGISDCALLSDSKWLTGRHHRWIRARYLESFGVTGNGVTTPRTVGNTLTGDMSCIADVAPDSVTPATYDTLFAQWNSPGQRNFALYIQVTTGKIEFSYSVNGTAGVTVVSTAALASVGLVGKQRFFIGLYHNVDNGAGGNDTKFYWSLDKIIWTQLGNTVTTAGAVTRFSSSSGTITAFAAQSGLAVPLKGKGYRAQLYSGNYFSGTGTPVLDCNLNDWPETIRSGDSYPSSTTGEMWTLVNTGAEATKARITLVKGSISN